MQLNWIQWNQSYKMLQNEVKIKFNVIEGNEIWRNLKEFIIIEWNSFAYFAVREWNSIEWNGIQ
jgi:hypothetical protein